MLLLFQLNLEIATAHVVREDDVQLVMAEGTTRVHSIIGRTEIVQHEHATTIHEAVGRTLVDV